MTDAESTDADIWRTSTASQPNDNCVEVAIGVGAVRVRHSHDRAGAVLSFTHAEWRAFLSGAQAGEFNLPELDPGPYRFQSDKRPKRSGV